MGLILPKDTKISKYFAYKGKIFEKMYIPDGRIMVSIVHTWGDGEIMNFGFGYEDGVTRSGINPMHIVGLYKTFPKKVALNSILDDFLESYYLKMPESDFLSGFNKEHKTPEISKSDTCVVCGAYVPEGSQLCPSCLKDIPE